MQTNQFILLAAFVLGGVVRALKTDGASAILTRLAARGPDEPPVKVPPRLLPWLALVFGGAAASVDALVLGAPWWPDAVVAGLFATATAVLGHELGSGVPGVRKVLGITLLLIPLSTMSACTPWQKSAARTVFDVAQIGCIIAHQDLPDGDVAKVCGLAEPFFEPMRNVLAQSRLQSGRAAAAAEARASAARCEPPKP